MIRRTTRALCIALAVAWAPALFAEALDPFAFPSPRELSMGGSHVALADDYSVLLTNPAGLASAPREVLAADLGLHLYGPIFDLLNTVMNGGADMATAAMDLLAANDYKLYTGLDISGPLALGYVGQGLGFGLFNRTELKIKASGAVSIGVYATEEILLSGGYAFSFDLGGGHALDLGLGAKGFVRGEVGAPMGILEATALFDDPTSILGEDFVLSTGIGFDLGLRWSWKSLAAGLVCRDLFSPAIESTYSSLDGFLNDPAGTRLGDPAYEFLDRKLDLGFAWSPDLGVAGRFIDSVDVALDYRDILSLFELGSRNQILNLGLGVEARMLDIVALRAGISEALLSVGAGIDMGPLKFGISVYGSEEPKSREPGAWPVYNLVADFSFRF